MKQKIFLLFLSTLPFFAMAQKKITSSGYVKDVKTGEALISASVYISNEKRGTTTNSYGFYSISVKQADSIGIVISYQGYTPQLFTVSGSTDQTLDYNLQENSNDLNGVIVSSAKNNNNISKARMSVINIPMKQIKTLPAIAGERDILKIVQLLPGVQSGKEGTTGFYVRWGNTDQMLDYNLQEKSNDLADVIVSSARNNNNISKARMSVINIPMKQIRTLPAIAGERDILKIVQLLPGVQSGKEGTTGFYVRGGNTDQNLVQLDEATIYNPNHLFGLFSTFNTNAMNSVTLIKGGFPAQYGGRLSSILDITMKEGNKKKFSGEGGVGLISGNLTLEGPIAKNKSSYIISARRTFFDLITKTVIPRYKNNTTYYFYDVNAKVNFELGKKDKLYLSYFTGLEDAKYAGASSLNYQINFGNSTAIARWNHLFNKKLFSNTSFIYNDYHLSLLTTQDKY